MRLTQGTFSFLPDLTDEQIEAQISYALGNGWSIMVEYTDDPHPRNGLWDMWSPPMFDLAEDEADVVMRDVNACREAHWHLYVKVVAYDRSKRRQTSAISFHRQPPEHEPGFRLERQETHDRVIRYTIHSYAGLNTPAGERYGGKGEQLAPIISESRASPDGANEHAHDDSDNPNEPAQGEVDQRRAGGVAGDSDAWWHRRWKPSRRSSTNKSPTAAMPSRQCSRSSIARWSGWLR